MSQTALTTAGWMLLTFAIGTGCNERVAEDHESSAAPVDATDVELTSEPLADSVEKSETQRKGPTAAQTAEAVAAISAAIRIPEIFERTSEIVATLSGLGPDAIDAVQQVLDGLTLDLGAIEYVLLTQFWAKHEPSAAAMWANRQAPRGFRLAAGLPAIESWARVDPLKASKYVETLSLVSSPNDKGAQISLVRGWFDSGVPGLEEYIEKLEMGIIRQRALYVYLRKLIQRDGPEVATVWAESLPDEPFRYKLAAFRQLASQLAIADPEMGIAFCAKHCDGEFGSGVRELIATRWARTDGRSVMDWLSAVPADTERDAAVLDAYRTFLRYDLDGALAYMAVLGPDDPPEWVRPAIRLYVGMIAPKHPATAIRWADSISQEDHRELQYVRTARLWRDIDEAAAEAWVEVSPLSEELREDARKPLHSKPSRKARRQR